MVSRRLPVLLMLSLLAVFALGTTAWAADGAAPTSMLQDMFGGGVFSVMIMITLFLLSMGDLALIIEHFAAIRRDVLVPDMLAKDIDGLLAAGEVSEALEVAGDDGSFLGKVVRAGLADLRSGYDAMYESMQAAGEEETTKLHRKIEYLSLIGNTAPMLGLFGTVYGMINAFKTIAVSGNPTPSDMAGGIYTALYTTLVGLMIAIPTMAMYTFFQNRIIRISLEVGGIAEELIRRFKPTQ